MCFGIALITVTILLVAGSELIRRPLLTLGSLKVTLPYGPPQVYADVRTKSGVRTLRSYAYGFRYPSMHLFTKGDWKEWMKIGDNSDWVRVEAKTAPRPSCNVFIFSSYLDRDFSIIRLHLASSFPSPEAYRNTIMVPSTSEFGLNHITLPPNPVLWDSKKYLGESDVYASGPPHCAEI